MMQLDPAVVLHANKKVFYARCSDVLTKPKKTSAYKTKIYGCDWHAIHQVQVRLVFCCTLLANFALHPQWTTGRHRMSANFSSRRGFLHGR
jgi:hypothetical protein